jgi:hypothetical protein
MTLAVPGGATITSPRAPLTSGGASLPASAIPGGSLSSLHTGTGVQRHLAIPS